MTPCVLLTPSTAHLSSSVKEIGKIPTLINLKQFSDGEYTAETLDHFFQGKLQPDIYLIHATCPPIHDNLILLSLILNYLNSKGCRVHLMLTYMGYTRQSLGVLQDIVRIIESPCLQKICLLDPHQREILDLFKKPTYELSANTLFVKACVDLENLLFVAADEGRSEWVRKIANIFQREIVILPKMRNHEGIVSYSISNNESDFKTQVSGKHILIIDDMIDSGETIIKASQILKSWKAQTIDVIATHGLFSGKALEKLEKSPIRQITITNSLPQASSPIKIEIIDIKDILIKFFNI